jgi:HK97 family phage prohead protease
MSKLEVVRALTAPARAKQVEDDDAGASKMPTMEVRFSALGNWYEIDSLWEGHFLERTAAGAFTKTMQENRDRIKVLFNHGFDSGIGQKVLGTIEDLREDPDAAVGDVALFDTSYTRDLLPGIEAGVYGSSMRMVVVKDEWDKAPARSKYNPDGIPERTIKEVRLLEFGPVTFPANPEATTGVRSATDAYYEQLRHVDPHAVEVARSLQTSTPPVRAAGDETTATPDGAARTNPDEPAASHSGGLTHAQRERLIHLNKERA